MQITKNVDVYADVDVNVEISVRDITEALHDAVTEADKSTSPYAVKAFLCDLYSCLQAVSGEMITRLSPGERQQVAAGMAEELNRLQLDRPLHQEGGALGGAPDSAG